jgi:hypothetical protein
MRADLQARAEGAEREADAYRAELTQLRTGTGPDGTSAQAAAGRGMARVPQMPNRSGVQLAGTACGVSPLAGDVASHLWRAMCHRPSSGMMPGQPGVTGSRRWTRRGRLPGRMNGERTWRFGPAQLIALGSASQLTWQILAELERPRERDLARSRPTQRPRPRAALGVPLHDPIARAGASGSAKASSARSALWRPGCCRPALQASEGTRPVRR